MAKPARAHRCAAQTVEPEGCRTAPCPSIRVSGLAAFKAHDGTKHDGMEDWHGGKVEGQVLRGVGGKRRGNEVERRCGMEVRALARARVARARVATHREGGPPSPRAGRSPAHYRLGGGADFVGRGLRTARDGAGQSWPRREAVTPAPPSPSHARGARRGSSGPRASATPRPQGKPGKAAPPGPAGPSPAVKIAHWQTVTAPGAGCRQWVRE